MFKHPLSALFLSVALSGPAFAADIKVMDAYARAASPSAKAGAAFMMLENGTDTDDRLIAARTDAAKRVELHTHIENDDGVMQMTEIDGGIALPAGSTHHMKRGGDHVMLMGLTGPLEQGAEVTVTLVFEEAGEIEVTISVDNERKAEHGHGHSGDDHEGHDHSGHDH